MARDVCPMLPDFFASRPWHKFLGVQIEALRRGYARIRLPYRADFVGNTDRRSIHGGVLAALADICAITTLWTYCEAADQSCTVDLKIDYLRPGPLEDMIAEGEIRLRGHRLANVVVHIHTADDIANNVAEARTVCYTIPAPHEDAREGE